MDPSTSNSMSLDLYKAAEDGIIDPFKNYAEPLNLLLTPIKDTILHLYLSTPTQRSTHFVQELLNICPSLLLHTNSNGDTPLHVATTYGHSNIVELFVQQAKTQHPNDLENGVVGATGMLRIINNKKETALHVAARNDHLSIVEVLTNEDPHFLYSGNDSGETPLYLAAERGHLEVVIKILNTCTSVAFAGPNGKTALHAAAMNRHRGVVQEILKNKTSLNNEADENGWTALHYAAYIGSSQVVEELLEYNKYVAYMTDNVRKRTALHLAACKGNRKSMRQIISKCPDCFKLVDDRGWSVFHYAAISRSDDALKIVLQNPSSMYLINGKDVRGNTPLHFLAVLNARPISPFLRPLAKGDPLVQYEHNFFDIYRLCRRSPALKKEILEWIEDLGIGPLGKTIIGKDAFVATYGEASDSKLIVAALVATVTFAAAFTLPGGYKSDGNERDQGSAILSKNSSFIAFVVADAIAMVLSTSSVLIHFMLPLYGYRARFAWLMEYEDMLIVYAIGAMVVAFVTGTFAVLATSLGLAITTCVIGLSFFVFGGYTAKGLQSSIYRFSGISSRN
ncbi:hypothetical protein JCGZ_01622 [Jatropha curcas]|uniref:PGG domain-containing protein n=1 Tax=Jatropha curcas TaxID=180498 RepID=A0A067L515_JATCU|nr:protein ACCELERATED CELL DEATH 6 [Jatropha curcas]KDP42298.1 hypothetical protein JCGZ_01622 [Jatropha curcas]